MRDARTDSVILAGGRGVWSATPWNYSSLRALRLKEDGTGDLIYGYGQTIYARIKCRWEVVSLGQLRLTYLDSPPALRFQGFTPSAGEQPRDLGYTLVEGEVTGTENIVGQPYKFLWTLELSEPPWPPGLHLPHEIPRVFFGHRQQSEPAGA